MMLKYIVAFVFAVVTCNAIALEAVTGKLTLVEGSYMPGTVTFILDAGSANCAAGRWLTWTKPDSNNVKAVYAGMLTAIAAGKKITVVFDDTDTTCVGRFIYFRAE